MKIKTSLAVVAAATLALAAGPALATGASHTVNVGGIAVPAGSPVSFTATTPTTGTNVLWSWRNNSGTIINLNCSSSTLAGTIQPGTDIVTITSSTWVSCQAPGGGTTQTHVGAWSLHSPNAYTSASNENVAGHVDDFDLKWQNTAAPAVCNFRIRGTGTAGKGLASATFDESTQKLTVSETGFTGNLRTQNVSGCGGQWQNGNPVNLQATYTVSATGGAINVTS